MKIVVALALSAHAFTPATPGGANRRKKSFLRHRPPNPILQRPGTNLEALLKENGIETLALCGFLTNCCVESSMRTAYEKGT